MSENIELNVLGCGSSFGVPLSHKIWGNCDKTNIKNYRTRPSILLKKAGKSILIDTSPDLRRQLIDNKIDVSVYPSNKNMELVFTEQNNYTIGGEIYNLPNNPDYEITRATKLTKNKEYITNKVFSSIK